MAAYTNPHPQRQPIISFPRQIHLLFKKCGSAAAAGVAPPWQPCVGITRVTWRQGSTLRISRVGVNYQVYESLCMPCFTIYRAMFRVTCYWRDEGVKAPRAEVQLPNRMARENAMCRPAYGMEVCRAGFGIALWLLGRYFIVCSSGNIGVWRLVKGCSAVSNITWMGISSWIHFPA